MKLIPSVLLLSFICLLGVKFLPVAYVNLGDNEFKKENYIAANKHYSQAVSLAPSNSDYRYKYVQTLTKLKPSIKVQKAVFDISEDARKDRAVYLAKQQIYLWNSQITSSYGSNYIEQTPYDNSVLRWNPATFPLKVAVDFPVESQMPEYYRNVITRAFYQWQNSTGFIKFTFSSNLKDADIIVKFLPLPESNCDSTGCKYVVAYTEPLIKNQQLKNMTITMYDKDAYGNYFSDKELYNTILHEIGHALGIMGHSYSTDDLMYMSASSSDLNSIFSRFRSSFQYISSMDLNTLKLLYNMTPTITNTPLSELKTEGLIYSPVVLGGIDKINKNKIKEAENYIKRAPDLPNGYIDLASAYAESGNIKKAEQNLQTALNLAKTPNERYIIYYNFAVVYLNNNMPQKALPYAQKAREITNNEDSAELISNIQHAISSEKEPFKDKMKTP